MSIFPKSVWGGGGGRGVGGVGGVGGGETA